MTEEIKLILASDFPAVDAYYTNGMVLIEIVESLLVTQKVRFRNSKDGKLFIISLQGFDKQYWKVHEPFGS